MTIEAIIVREGELRQNGPVQPTVGGVPTDSQRPWTAVESVKVPPASVTMIEQAAMSCSASSGSQAMSTPPSASSM